MSSPSLPLPENEQAFRLLLDRYLNDQATDDEIEQLLELINRGAHDETIKNRINEMLMSAADEDMPQDKTREMLDRILSAGRDNVKVVPMRKEKKHVRWLAAAAVITILAIVITWRMVHVKEEASVTLAQNTEAIQPPTIYIGKQFIHLPDGSTALLNEGSELRYSDAFGKEYREVTLIGEGYFDIQHDSAHPFKVRTGKITTTVLGTAFNVKAIPGQQEVKVTVARGKVQVGDENHVYGTITPDQQIAVNTVTYEFVQSNVKSQEATEWKSQYLILDDLSLADAATTIEQKYKVSITFSDKHLKDCRISATFLNGEDLKQVLAVLTTVVGATYTRQGTHINISGDGCN